MAAREPTARPRRSVGASSAKPAAQPAPPAANDASAEERAVAGFLDAVRKGFEEVTT